MACRRLILWALILVTARVFVDRCPSDAGERAASTPPDLLNAVRTGDHERVERLLRLGADANARDDHGTTALMLATVVADGRMVQTLLDHGADVNAKNRAGATALMWAVGDRDKVRSLLRRGADVNARADSGRTPLVIAAGNPGGAEVVKLLCDAGADARDGYLGYTALMSAVEGRDREVIQLLLAKGADAKSKNRAGWTALHAAAETGDWNTTKDLLAHGAEPNAADTIQGRTPLLWAAAGGHGDVARLLLDHGARGNVSETLGGTTPLICAAGSERGDVGLVKVLLDRGARVDDEDVNGASALDWARRRGSLEILEVLKQRRGRLGHAGSPQRLVNRMGNDNTVVKAVAAAVPLLQQTSETFFTKSGQNCVSCHHQSLPAWALELARERGFSVDEKKAKLQTETTQRLLAGRRERLLQGAGVVDQLDAGYWLLALSAGGLPRNELTDAIVHVLTMKQSPDGNWRPTLPRPPANDSDFTATSLAVRGLQHYGPPGRRDEITRRIALARRWLLKSNPTTTEARTFQLLGLKWSGAASQDIDSAVARLLAEQNRDGGWSQLAAMTSDAYATGQALVALRQAGDRASSVGAYQRGVRFLLQTQLADGSWFVESRSLPVQPYFESGFPHDRSQFISCFASSWATMALALTAEPLQSR
ncbi:MAG TPA: ankyrin repeat domain-containing protein [Planctomycetaceae bacterium]|nr:ankyrin repeat domain-containing protein [Planctomycetaceae bacterium]